MSNEFPFSIWKYPQGGQAAEQVIRRAAQQAQQVGFPQPIFVPVFPGEDAHRFSVELPGTWDALPDAESLADAGDLADCDLSTLDSIGQAMRAFIKPCADCQFMHTDDYVSLDTCRCGHPKRVQTCPVTGEQDMPWCADVRKPGRPCVFFQVREQSADTTKLEPAS